MHARSAGPASVSGRSVNGRSRWKLFRESPALTPESTVPSSIVEHGDERIPAMRRALYESRHACSRASSCISRDLICD